MAFDLPDSPVSGDTYTIGGHIWQYDGTAWGAMGATSPGIKTQVFTASGTYTPSPGMKYCMIECMGGGGGGGAVDGAANTSRAGGSGGGGGYSQALKSAAAVGASQTVTIGALGAAGTAGDNNGSAGTATSVGSLCVANGGGGGQSSPTGFGLAGVGATAGTGDIASPGPKGNTGLSFGAIAEAANYTTPGPTGANTRWGSGGQGGLVGAGGAASGYGAGGGAGEQVNSATDVAGGNGAPGLVIITEYMGVETLTHPGMTTTIFTSGTAQTFTPTTGAKYFKVTVTGGGGGGGGSDTDATGAGAGAGGEAGGTCIKWYTAAEMGATATYTVGTAGTGGLAAGGTGDIDGTDTTFAPAGSGATLTAAGGDGGGGSGTATTDSTAGLGGQLEGTATGGDINISGGGGQSGVTGLEGSGFAPFAIGGMGGASYWGGGGRGGQRLSAGDSAGSSSVAYGAGGGGAASTDSATGAAGGDGKDGIIVIEQFIGAGVDVSNWNPTGTIYPGSLSYTNTVATGSGIEIINTGSGGAGPIISTYHPSASPANADNVFTIDAWGKDSGAADENYGQLVLQTVDVTAGSEDAKWYIGAKVAGAMSYMIVQPGGIGFPVTQLASADPNVLDDYEEGTWTPAYTATGATYSYQFQAGYYTKTGNVIRYEAFMWLNSSGNTLGTAQLFMSMPFARGVTNYGINSGIRWNASTTSMINCRMEIPSGSASASFLHLTAAATAWTTTNSNHLLHATNQSYMMVNGTYVP